MRTSDKRKRRDFLKKAAYSAPAILSLQAVSAVAKAGSIKDPDEAREEQEAKEKEKQAEKKEKEAKKKEEEAKKKAKKKEKEKETATQNSRKKS